jgi:hypothetical protein
MFTSSFTPRSEQYVLFTPGGKFYLCGVKGRRYLGSEPEMAIENTQHTGLVRPLGMITKAFLNKTGNIKHMYTIKSIPF